MENKAIFKYNNGVFALLCSNCRTIIKTGFSFTPIERAATFGRIKLPAQYCEKCLNLQHEQKIR